MTIRLNPRWLLISALLFSLQFCRAQVEVPPTISFDLGDSNAPETQLWDLNGSYALNLEVVGRNGASVPVQLTFVLLQDPKGKLSSTEGFQGLTFNDDVNSSFGVTVKITGKVTGSAGTARAHFVIHFAGSGSLGGQSTDVNGSVTVDAFTDTSTGELVGAKSSKFSAQFPGLNSISGKADFAMPLPTDGSWNLTLRLVGVTKLTGTGIITTPSRNLGLDLAGKFKSGLTKVKAKGAGDVPDASNGTGTSATIILPDTFDTIQFDGKVLGQKMFFFFPLD
jgi:hypothetical protein